MNKKKILERLIIFISHIVQWKEIDHNILTSYLYSILLYIVYNKFL